MTPPSEIMDAKQRRAARLADAQAPVAAIAGWLGLAFVLLLGVAGVVLGLGVVGWSVRFAWRLAVVGG